MSVISLDLNRRPVIRTARRQGFWHGLARRLDALVAYASKHAVSEQELRRADADIRRCRELIGRKDPPRKEPSRNIDLACGRVRPVRIKVR
jgi:hypothetical protein